MLKDPVKIPCPEKANRGRRTSKKEVFQAKRKKEGRVDASSDPHDRRVKNDIGETIDSRWKWRARRWKIIKFSIIIFLSFLFFFFFFFFWRSKGKTCFYAPVDSRNIFARLTKALSQRLLVSPTKNRHFSPTYFPRSPSPSSVATFGVSLPIDRYIFRIAGCWSMETDRRSTWISIRRILVSSVASDASRT